MSTNDEKKRGSLPRGLSVDEMARFEQAVAPVGTVPAKWTNDCQGKKDFDGNLVTLSTRYWPRGGGFDLLRPSSSVFEGNEARPEIRPSAKATIYIGDTADEWYAHAEPLVEREFEGESQEDVQREVEAWASEQYERIAESLRREFSTEATND